MMMYLNVALFGIPYEMPTFMRSYYYVTFCTLLITSIYFGIFHPCGSSYWLLWSIVLV